MRDYTYNFEIEDLIVQFIDAFNDVVIKRYNNEREEQDHIHVNFVYSPKKRVLYDILNKNPNPSNLPVIAVYVNNLARDVNRVENKMAKSYFVNGTNNIKERRQPVPVKVEMGMSVITKSTQDMLQILSNWIPYTDPYIYIDVEDPSTAQIIRTKVTWNQNININQELDNPEATFRTGFDTSFTIDGYLFKKVLPDAERICKITTNFSSVTALNNCFMDIKSFEKSINLTAASKTTHTIEGVAKMSCVTPWLLSLGHDEYTFNITGKNLDFITSLYLSATPGMFPTSAYSYYNFFPDLSANIPINQCSESPSTSTEITTSKCQSFSGISVSAYGIYNNGSKMQFTLPYNPSTIGIFDIIAITPCGCSKLSIDSILETANPYPSGTSEWQTFTAYQPPVAQNGGIVISELLDINDINDRLLVLQAASANWQSVYTTVCAYSAIWNTTTTNAYLPLSGGTLTGRVTANEDILFSNTSKTVVLISPGNFRYRITVDDTGALVTTLI
jgi:hypothetical protein